MVEGHPGFMRLYPKKYVILRTYCFIVITVTKYVIYDILFTCRTWCHGMCTKKHHKVLTNTVT
jgi:hypothetical protein